MMKVSLKTALNNPHLDAKQSQSQRQLSLSIAAVSEASDISLPINLCLVIDRSGSMAGKALETVKSAAIQLVSKLNSKDRLSVVVFDHNVDVIVPNQAVSDIQSIQKRIEKLMASGGTCIDEGIKVGIREIGADRKDRVCQIFVLTDGENEHGDNNRCLKLAELASEHNITIHTLGFGTFWNQNVLEAIADKAGGTLSYIEYPEQAVNIFQQLFRRMQSVGLTNAYLRLELMPQVSFAQFKPLAQVEPETIELETKVGSSYYEVRLGDLMRDQAKVILANLYIDSLPLGQQTIAKVQIRYDNLASGQMELLSESVPISVNVQDNYQPLADATVEHAILRLAKYRQTQIAEEKLSQGDRKGAATLLQTAAKTALQLGDKSAATVLQASATQLQAGQDLSEAQRKKTRMVSKTILQSNDDD